MHKAGTSDTEHGISAATNDIDLITLPDGRRLAIAVFVTDSTANDQMRNAASPLGPEPVTTLRAC